ncbi:MAG: 1-deoxy-D-xylulose-5-phosphate synthase [Candidatus Omnitrophica bacterium CG22_combo_CG10-13_8_21_14_all_43_16]|nr:MAG: 1-deoxy-D-xylulose-5-phosphate synthase [Candidatus Omnitrophica bacterium CG22_combo_CG10-13_8_21_14_all_43_16]
MAERLLDSINSPADLKKLSTDKLPILAQEIREVIIKTVASSGGHLASSLGAVELIIGLHYCLNTPEDIIIWDVGHQAYAHKILTGRKDRFDTLRKQGGLSGFPNKYESEYDVFTTGHGSTSISTALGIASARDLENKNYKVVAVIGDASLGGGMALEALNHAGHLHKNMLVILNDNEMSISKSVGALSKYLNRIITAPVYNKIRKDVEGLLSRVPRFGFSVIRSARRLEEGLKNLLVPGMLFEELGFRYFGPIDGNDVVMVTNTLKNIIELNKPILLHVLTKKGKGYSFAEKGPEKFHGVASFNVDTGEKVAIAKDIVPEEGFTKAFGNKIIEIAREDKKIVAITAAMPEGTGLDKFADLFPDRFFDAGMAEQHAVGFAAGLGKAGFKPVVAIYSTFLQRSYDQIFHDVCLQNLNVIFMLDRAGLVGEDGPTHHGAFDMSYIRNLPNIVSIAPRDEEELKNMLSWAVSYDKGPVAIRYPRGASYASAPGSKNSLPINYGKGEILKEGRDVTMVSIGYMSNIALEAASFLLKDRIDAEVINARFIKPIDIELIAKSVLKTGRLFTIEEGALSGGFGSGVLELIIDKIKKDTIIKNIALPDKFIEHGDRQALLDKYGLSSKKITEAVKKEWQK